MQSQNEGQGNSDAASSPLRGGLVARMIQRLAHRLPVRHIRKTMPDGSLAAYLERYSIVRTKPLAIYLHHFVDRDQDTELHDHPWTALSVVLTGGYVERRLLAGLQTQDRHIRFGNWIRPDCFHMITEAKPGTWTLLVRFRKTKGWGFIGNIQNDQASYRPAGLPGNADLQAEHDKHII
ncbi:hypothetical protein [Stutzerimonas stutzeri]|uniref:hypothetical protein n=1 Tax=Stutzerimonas stutzeri TaxID=316 RepID=UPI00265CDC17|nr:hypothetical protein [Stutzerimonas stutzeri]MCF6783396.1 hypothetical protein [Stutzerimonas stutzeri]